MFPSLCFDVVCDWLGESPNGQRCEFESEGHVDGTSEGIGADLTFYALVSLPGVTIGSLT